MYYSIFSSFSLKLNLNPRSLKKKYIILPLKRNNFIFRRYSTVIFDELYIHFQQIHIGYEDNKVAENNILCVKDLKLHSLQKESFDILNQFVVVSIKRIS